eukprot:snap_masked-scaffold2772_size12454-processed-gene-0.0 protein:Tk06864 transcript:snap_masked-scaffold2772_size12454-processed-gene-0.0-mRNA-1 annotation:"PREDICTED: uncharacterized protein LOC101255235"
MQQYAVDQWAKIEGSRLDWVRHNQKSIRAEKYKGLLDAASDGELVAADPTKNSRLYRIITNNNIHGPCGTANPNSPSMDGHGDQRHCTKNFPKEFCYQTLISDDGYPEYRRIIREEIEFDVVELQIRGEQGYATLNMEQKNVFDQIYNAVTKEDGQLFALNPSGGTRKTNTINLLPSRLRSEGKIASATALSGIAATMLENGRTLHSSKNTHGLEAELILPQEVGAFPVFSRTIASATIASATIASATIASATIASATIASATNARNAR